jgi:hypothetical protein
MTYSQSQAKGTAIRLFYSYSHRDEALRDQLNNHLAMLKRRGMISDWHDRRIGAGAEWKDQIDQNLDLAQVILLLISADFLASDYCYDIEMKRAMERHKSKDARVIPVILRPCDWGDAPFGELQALPKDAKPITAWSNEDEGWLNVAQGIKAACQELRQVQVPGILIYSEMTEKSGLLVWPKCSVRLPGPDAETFAEWSPGATQDLAWGKSVKVPLTPNVEYTIFAYTGVPLSTCTAVAKATCVVREGEVLQFVYRIAVSKGNSYEEMFKAQLIQVVSL